jgi:hypothetical protein
LGALVALLLMLSLAACGRSSAAEQQPSLDASAKANTPHNAAVTLQPASGYGGLYIQVSGEDWPQSMLVLVTIEDSQGRSETLAASDTDQAGKLNTGFLFPIDQRWLAADSLSVVATTADGRVESKAGFTIVEPGTQIASSSTSTSTSVAAASQNETTQPSGESSAQLDEEPRHTVVMPLIASTGPQLRNSQRKNNGRNNERSRNPSKTKSAGAARVDIDIAGRDSGSIDCRDGDEWIRVVLYSGGGFDATRIDPGSVTVSGASTDLGYSGDSAFVLAAFNAAGKQGTTARSRQAYQWLWRLEDADGDGSTDMVMEFRLDYIDLECGAAAVAVTGRTKDGQSFEGTNRIDMLVLERS